jgi:hypothetical protein
MPCLSLESPSAFLETDNETEAGGKPLVLLTLSKAEGLEVAFQNLAMLRVWIPPDFELKAEESKSPQLERTRLHKILIIGTVFMGSWRGAQSPRTPVHCDEEGVPV